MNLFNQLHIAQQNNIAVALCTIIESSGSTPRKAGTKMLVYANGEIFGSIGGGAFEFQVIEKALEVLTSNQSIIHEFCMHPAQGMHCGGKAKVFIEPIISQAQLYIFGAGHIGSFLAQLALSLNFRVTLVDNRTEVLDTITQPGINKINLPYADAINEINFNKNTYICIATHNHQLDKELVALCAKKAYAYLGMLGSKNKITKIKAEFIDNNILSEEEMALINWPMGIPIACETPQEIAVSILAKLVDIRASIK